MLTWDDITSSTHDYIVPRSSDVVYKASPILTRLKTSNAQKFEGGNQIVHDIGYQELNGGAFNRGGTFDTSYVQTNTALKVVPKFYYVNITMFGTDDVIVRGPEAVLSLAAKKFANAAAKMAKLISTDAYLDGQGTNSATNQIDGFQAWIDNGNNYTAVGGITRSDLVSNGTNNQGINGYVDSLIVGSVGHEVGTGDSTDRGVIVPVVDPRLETVDLVGGAVGTLSIEVGIGGDQLRHLRSGVCKLFGCQTENRFGSSHDDIIRAEHGDVHVVELGHNLQCCVRLDVGGIERAATIECATVQFLITNIVNDLV